MGTVVRGFTLNFISLYTYDTQARKMGTSVRGYAVNHLRELLDTQVPHLYIISTYMYDMLQVLAWVCVCVCSDINHLRKLLDTHVTHL